MSFKIIKRRKIQEWVEETINLINIILEGKKIPIDLRELPPSLKEIVIVNTLFDSSGIWEQPLSLCPKISWSIQVWSNGVVPFRKQFVRM